MAIGRSDTVRIISPRSTAENPLIAVSKVSHQSTPEGVNGGGGSIRETGDCGGQFKTGQIDGYRVPGHDPCRWRRIRGAPLGSGCPDQTGKYREIRTQPRLLFHLSISLSEAFPKASYGKMNQTRIRGQIRADQFSGQRLHKVFKSEIRISKSETNSKH